MKPTVCLVMIVKNEAHVIRRALDSAKTFIDFVYICDTGSSDKTPRVITDWMDENDVEGFVHMSPWVSFAHNRTEAMQMAGNTFPDADWLLMLDADAVLSGELPDAHALAADVVMCKQRLQSNGEWCEYYRPALVNAMYDWEYKGVVHEYLDMTDMVHSQSDTLVTTHIQDGARAKDPNKFKKDAALLGSVVDPTDRDVFYLAQSLRDAQELEEALDAYKRRTRMDGPAEYTYNAFFEIAKLLERLQRPYNDVLHAYLRAYSFRKTRAEPLVEAARYARLSGEYETALSLAVIAKKIPRPDDVFVVDMSCYTWRAEDEVAMALFFLGNEHEAWDVYRDLLASGNVPATQAARIMGNMGALIR